MASVVKIILALSLTDLPTFVLPNTLFGICTAMCDSMWAAGSLTQSSIRTSSWSMILSRIVQTVLWNWINLLLFNLSNQRLPDSIAEDRINKPHRPIVAGMLKATSARRALLYGIPSVVLASYFWLGAYEESIIMMGLTWMYNDLKGGDESFVIRNLLIAISFGVYNHASARIARGWTETGDVSSTLAIVSIQDPVLNLAGQRWIILISFIILTTMQVQDLQDMEGDRKRGRNTMMLVVGLKTSRWCTAIPVLLWSLAIPGILEISTFNLPLLISTGLGAYTAWRIVCLTKKEDDSRTWILWALWLIALYTLPLVAEKS